MLGAEKGVLDPSKGMKIILLGRKRKKKRERLNPLESYSP